MGETTPTQPREIPAGAFNEAATKAARKKTGLFTHDLPRYSVRAILAGAYLTLGTAFAAVGGAAAEKVAPGTGAFVFGMLFFIGLASILLLGAELATGTMMLMCFGASRRELSWPKALLIIVVTTVFNLVGAILVAVVIGQSAKLGGIGPDHLLGTLTEGKLTKTPTGIFLEATAANFVVNMAVVGSLLIKDYAGKFFFTQFVIGIFVVLGLDHLIANFSLFSLSFFTIDGGLPHLDPAHVLTNWGMAFLGNLLGGGVLIGSVYAWLNRGENAGAQGYRD